MPWVGNIAKTMTSNRKQLSVTHEKLTAVARHLSITRLFVFHLFDPFALLYNKSLNDWSLGEQWILFPSNLNVSLQLTSSWETLRFSGNIEILRKQNSMFPSGPVIKCLTSRPDIHFTTARHWSEISIQSTKITLKKIKIQLVHTIILLLLSMERWT